MRGWLVGQSVLQTITPMNVIATTKRTIVVVVIAIVIMVMVVVVVMHNAHGHGLFLLKLTRSPY